MIYLNLPFSNISSFNKSHNFIIGHNILYNTYRIIKPFINSNRIVIISDDIVAKLWLPTIQKSLNSANISTHSFIFTNGEASKSFNTACAILDFLASINFNKSDLLIALGGGVVSDITSFCAANFKRGVNFISMPTTLIAQLDASIGGKSGINSLLNKNIIGTFWHPVCVICDTATLSSLPNYHINQGIAEAVKSALIADPQLFLLLYNIDPCRLSQFINAIIISTISVKAKLVYRDPFDCNIRQLLNFGHTIAHAIESISNFSIPHGHALAYSIAFKTAQSNLLGITKHDFYQPLLEIFKKFKLPYILNFSPDYIYHHIFNDKKIFKDLINITLIKSIGSPIIKPFKIDAFYNFLKGDINICL